MQFCIFCSAPAVAIVNVGGAQETLCAQHLAERRRQHEGNLTTHHVTALGGPSDLQVAHEEMVEQLRSMHRSVSQERALTEQANRTIASLRAEMESMQLNHEQVTHRQGERIIELGGRVHSLTEELNQHREPDDVDDLDPHAGSDSDPVTVVDGPARNETNG